MQKKIYRDEAYYAKRHISGLFVYSRIQDRKRNRLWHSQ